MIWEKVLDRHSLPLTWLWQDKVTLDNHDPSGSSSIDLRFMRISRQVYVETALILYTTCQFVFDGPNTFS